MLFGELSAPAKPKQRKAPKEAGVRVIFPPAPVVLPSNRAVTHEDTQVVRDVEMYAQARANALGRTLKASSVADPTTGLKFRVIELMDGRNHLMARLFCTFYAPAMRCARQMLDEQLQAAGLHV